MFLPFTRKVKGTGFYLLSRFRCQYSFIWVGSIIALFLLTGNAWCGSLNDLEVLAGEWKETGDVKKLFDTPLGAVYKFGLSDRHSVRAQAFRTSTGGIEYREPHEKKCSCNRCKAEKKGIKGLLQINFGGRKVKPKRFVVLDFKLRAYPALDNRSTAEFRFQLVRSAEEKLKSDYRELNGLLDISSRNNSPRTFQTAYELRPEQPKISGIWYGPAFGPRTYRIIFDTATGEHTYFMNGRKFAVHDEHPIKGRRIEISTFGILCQDVEGSWRRHLEISPPKIFRFNSPELLDELPELRIGLYPYDGYVLPDLAEKRYSPDQEYRKVRTNPNPDLQYAYALRWLYSDDCRPEQALKLLEKAADDGHVLANYELGICHYRGYGMEQNLKKADRYLELAEESGCATARMLRGMILWRKYHQPRFTNGKRWQKELTEYALFAAGQQKGTSMACLIHDCCVFRDILFADNTIFFCAEYSPKLFSYRSLIYYHDALRRHPATEKEAERLTSQLIERTISRGYLPAYLETARYLEFGNKKRQPRAETVATLRKGVEHGALDSFVYLLTLQAQNGELKSDDFTPLNALLLGEEPAYLLLDYAAAHRDSPNVQFLLQSGWEEAERRWTDEQTPEARFLLGLRLWMKQPRPFSTVVIPERLLVTRETEETDESLPYRHTRLEQDDPNEDDFHSGFEHLEAAAEAGIPGAQYLIGYYYCIGDIPGSKAGIRQDESWKHGVELIRRAADSGNWKARYFILEQEIEAAMPSRYPELMKEVESFCMLQYPPAFLLRAKLLEKQKRPREELQKAYAEAAERGTYSSWHLLALRAEKENRQQEARELWKKYIRADREHRRQDRYDIFYPEITVDPFIPLLLSSSEENKAEAERLLERRKRLLMSDNLK